MRLYTCLCVKLFAGAGGQREIPGGRIGDGLLIIEIAGKRGSRGSVRAGNRIRLVPVIKQNTAVGKLAVGYRLQHIIQTDGKAVTVRTAITEFQAEQPGLKTINTAQRSTAANAEGTVEQVRHKGRCRVCAVRLVLAIAGNGSIKAPDIAWLLKGSKDS